MKRHIILALLLIGSLSLFAANLRILHTNDSHGAYEPGRDGIGGYIALEYHLEECRSEVEHSLYLDAGDMLTGTIFSSLEYEDLVGGAVLEVFSRLGLDAATLGNHEFDISYDHVKALVAKADFPFFSANIFDTDGSSVGRAGSGIFTRGDLKIGVVGLTIESLPERVKAENVQDLTILPYMDALEPILPHLDEATDLIILLTHNGWEEDLALARALDEGRVDLILGGHSHVTTDEPVLVNGIYILSAGSHLKNLGCIDLVVENDSVTSIESRMISLTQPPADYSSKISGFLHNTISDMEIYLAREVGALPFDFEIDKFRRTRGSDWVANALLAQYPAADLAMINNGGLRKHLEAGPVTLRDLHEYIPFGNTVVLLTCSGDDLMTAQAKNLEIAQKRPYDIMSVSSPDWMQDAFEFRIGGEPIQPQKLYRVVTHDYIISQWDKYLGFRPREVYETGDLFLDAIISQMQLEFGQE